MTNFANEPVIEDAWYIAGWSHELSDGPIARRIMDEDVVLFRTVNGKAGALEDRCCHRGVRLSLGECTDTGIRWLPVWLSGPVVNVLITLVRN